jgi:hypothetical protein
MIKVCSMSLNVFYICITLFGLMSISGCTSTFYMSPVINENSNQSLYYSDGKEIAISKGVYTSVALYVLKTEQKELLIHILYQNDSDVPINVIPDRINIKYANRDEDFDYMHVYTAERYIKKLRRGQFWQKFAIALNALSQSLNGGTSTTYGTVGGQPVYTKTYDPAKQALVNQKNQDDLRRVAIQNDRLNKAVDRGLIKRNTLSPGYYIEGNVMVKYKSVDKFTISVPFGPDEHIMEFKRPRN